MFKSCDYLNKLFCETTSQGKKEEWVTNSVAYKQNISVKTCETKQDKNLFLQGK